MESKEKLVSFAIEMTLDKGIKIWFKEQVDKVKGILDWFYFCDNYFN